MADNSSKVLFIIGGGPRIGYSVAEKFIQEGYKVAIGRRDVKEMASAPGLNGVVPVAMDLTKPGSVENGFREVESKLGHPNVVVYNAAALTFPTDASDPFAIKPADYEQDITLNVSQAYAALHESTRGFQAIKDKDVPKVFIATGNVSPFDPIPLATTLGSGKGALTYLIELGQKAYEASGFKFYFASQVMPNGGLVMHPDVSGPAHGHAYWEIVKGEMGQGGWDMRFTADAEGKATERKG